MTASSIADTETPFAPAAVQALPRLAPLDWMRGLVMILMAVDHSSEAFNGGRLFTDSVAMYEPGSPLPAGQFLTRWMTHLCAPTFLFLAGTGLSFTVHKQVVKGESPWAIDRYLLLRGLLIAGFELWISWFVMPQGKWLLQVLYAIGASYLFMIPLRRLPRRIAGFLGLGLVLGGEALVGLFLGNGSSSPPWLVSLLLTGGQRPPLIMPYPAVHWLAVMLLGWAWGGRLLASSEARHRPTRELALTGFLALLVFLAIRGANGYGNMRLLREGNSVIQWLHVSKYPPSIAYVALELGIMCLCLAVLFEIRSRYPAFRGDLLLVFGQTPMFFYVLHFPLLAVTADGLGVAHRLGLWSAYLGAAVVVAALYPACLWYRSYKGRHRDGWPRYI